nr:hypothetical protein L204_00669 [Cryptococcus depauperatus CBS 7855]
MPYKVLEVAGDLSDLIVEIEAGQKCRDNLLFVVSPSDPSVNIRNSYVIHRLIPTSLPTQSSSLFPLPNTSSSISRSPMPHPPRPSLTRQPVPTSPLNLLYFRESPVNPFCHIDRGVYNRFNDYSYFNHCSCPLLRYLAVYLANTKSQKLSQCPE